MFEQRHHDAHFNVSYFDLFVHGVNANGSVFFSLGLANEIAAANAVLARWDDPTGFEDPVGPFVYSYSSFLVDRGLVNPDAGLGLIGEEKDRPGTFLAPLGPEGKRLAAYLTGRAPGLLAADEVGERARAVLSLRTDLFRPEIAFGEREAESLCSAMDYGGALGRGYRVLRLDPDSTVAREVVATARAAPSPLSRVDCSHWLPAGPSRGRMAQRSRDRRLGPMRCRGSCRSGAERAGDRQLQGSFDPRNWPGHL